MEEVLICSIICHGEESETSRLHAQELDKSCFLLMLGCSAAVEERDLAVLGWQDVRKQVTLFPTQGPLVKLIVSLSPRHLAKC